jgi:excinuclease ABC subunit A
MAEDSLIVRGAREHNFGTSTSRFPRDKLTVITGLSGSGKSSLAFDTIYAEGQRRYVESLSRTPDSSSGLMENPDVDSIEGLSPAISIEQKTAGHNPRSTVGTVTEIYDYLRLLWARVGTPHCPNCGRPVQRQSAAQIADIVLTWPRDTRHRGARAAVQGRKGEFRELFESVRKQGFIRAYVDGELIEVASPPKLNRRQNHTIEVVVDRLVVRTEDRGRVADSIETALKLADGVVEIVNAQSGAKEMFSERYGCPSCGISLPELEPRTSRSTHRSARAPSAAVSAPGGR